MSDLTPLELKSATEANPADEVKTALDALTADVAEKTAPVAELAKRLDGIEAKLSRPNLGGKSEENTDDKLEAKALDKALRHGVESLDADERKAMNWGTPSAGGYVTQPEYSTQIVDKITELSPVRQVARVLSIGSERVYVPVLANQLDGTWVTETGTRQEDEPTFDQVEINAHEHAVIVPVSLQLLEDSFIDLPAFLSGHIAERFAKAESTAFVTGDGNGKPTGWLDDLTGFAQTVVAADGSDIETTIFDMLYSLPAAYAARGSWLMNRRTIGTVRKALDTALAGVAWSDSARDGTPAMLLGRPVYEAPDAPDLDTDGAITLADFGSGYTIADRIGVQILRDDYTGRGSGVVKFHARRRIGGKVVQPDAFAVSTISAS